MQIQKEISYLVTTLTMKMSNIGTKYFVLRRVENNK